MPFNSVYSVQDGDTASKEELQAALEAFHGLGRPQGHGGGTWRHIPVPLLRGCFRAAVWSRGPMPRA